MLYKTEYFLLMCTTIFLENFAFIYNNNKYERKCKISHIHGLKSADCYHLDLKEFPNYLPRNVEVIELSYNRIRKITAEDLNLYPNIIHLYLTDNMITLLKNDTFIGLNYLETIDLTLNGLIQIPPEIFQVPSLKTLYLSQNKNINVAETIEKAKPAIYKSSLQKFDFSFITEEEMTTDFPDFQQLPLIVHLNVSGNDFNSVTPNHFAKLCNLEKLININTTFQFENNCDCWLINKWLKERKVQFSPFSCSTINCGDAALDDEDLKLFNECRENVKLLEKSLLFGKIKNYIITVCLIVSFMILGLLYWIWNKRNRKVKEKICKNFANSSNEPLNNIIH